MSERNRETAAAWRFHNATKYVRAPGAAGADELVMGEAPDLGPAIGEQDPAIEPKPFKIYPSLEPVVLPRSGVGETGAQQAAPLRDGAAGGGAVTIPALEALAGTGELAGGEVVPDRGMVAELCLRSNGVLKHWRSQGGRREIAFRAAGCTGARYHLEWYLVCGALADLEAGVYHYAAHDHSLRRLRAGDYRAVVVAATGGEPAVAEAPAIFVCTSTFWRNAWRYQARAYRHVYWDAGTLFANLLAVAAGVDLPTKVVLGFADEAVNGLLDVDGEREAAVGLIALGRGGGAVPAASEALAVGPLGLPTEPISAREIVFPEIGAMHSASGLASGAEARAWRERPGRRTMATPSGRLTELRPLGAGEIPDEAIAAVIQRRRSNRHYAAERPLPFALFSTVLDRATRGTAIDALDPTAPSLYDVYLIVNNVEGLAPGTYVLDRARGAVELLAVGDQREGAARIACNQEYAAEAHVNVYAMTDLGPVLARYGNRGYRLAQLEAALFAGRLQLAAHALGLGAVGSTSVDDEVTEFFSPHAAGKSFMFVAVFGERRRKALTP